MRARAWLVCLSVLAAPVLASALGAGWKWNG